MFLIYCYKLLCINGIPHPIWLIVFNQFQFYLYYFTINPIEVTALTKVRYVQ